MDTTRESEFNNCIREYNRLVRQFARINNVQLGVLKLLKNLSFIDWFRYTSIFNNPVSRVNNVEMVRDYLGEYTKYYAEQNGGKLILSDDGRIQY